LPIALALLVAARPAHAVTLATPWIFVGGRVGAEVDSCGGLPLAPKTCGVGASRRDDFHCVVKSSSGAVRAAATVMLPGTTSTAVVVVPATAK
jgi:hypothetical protein